ncbi:MFS transporter [Iamia majanohamensis]|uniref:MFS transporter n=1 Tax=Iamia majanohamensis TaxID=467976 RepID=A0AAF0BWH0_9ACTN|nr:MFS transporter [Iamia majanohamensis]WCO68048.1 MFS transporter [Iamia majanohamensis]
MIRLLRTSPSFRRLFLAHTVSRAGDAFNTVALVVLVFDLTGSGIGVAGAVMFEVAPVLLLGPLAGLAADRLPRRRLLIGADLARALIALGLVVAAGRLGVAYAVAFGLSAGAVIFNPAAASLLPEVVDEEELVTANSALWTAAVIVQVALAPLAGIVIAAAGVEVAFALNAATFVASALILVRLDAGHTPTDIDVRRWSGVLAGVRTVRSDPLLTRLAAVQVLASLSAGATGGLLVVLADRWLGTGPRGFGILLAAIGVGAAVGPLALRRFIHPGDKRWLFGPFAVRGGVDLTLAAIPNPVVAGGALVAYGMSTSTGMIAYQSTLQTTVPPETRGRAFAFYDVLWNTARLLSLAVGGVLAEITDVRLVYVTSAALLLAAAGLTTKLPPHPPTVSCGLEQ